MEFGKTVGVTLTVLVLFGVGGMLSEQVKPALAEPGGLTAAQQERLEKVATASLFGQFRTSMSDYLWLKTDKYMHRGVELRGTTDQEKASGTADKVSTNSNDAVKMKHRDETTVVPSKANDWRGHIGDIEREVSPYMDMDGHSHGNATETLPLFRLITWSNPHFIKGYIVGSTLIGADKKRVDEAIDFLREGEANNPESIEIKTELGMFFTRKKLQYDVAMPYLLDAIRLAKSRDAQTINEDEKDAWQYAYRWAVLNRRDAGAPAVAKQLAEEGIKLFPDDIVCKEYLAGKH